MENQRYYSNFVNKSTESLNTLSFVEYLLSDLESYEKAFIHKVINMKDLINSKTRVRSLYTDFPESSFGVAQLNDNIRTIMDVQKELSGIDRHKHVMKKIPNKGDKSYLKLLNFSDDVQITQDQKEELISLSFEKLLGDLETTPKVHSDLQEINDSPSIKFDNFMQTCEICKTNNDDFELYTKNNCFQNSEPLSTLSNQLSNGGDVSKKFEVCVVTSNINQLIQTGEFCKQSSQKRKTKKQNSKKVNQYSDLLCFYCGSENGMRTSADDMSNRSVLPGTRDRVIYCDTCRYPSYHEASGSDEKNIYVILCDDFNSDDYKTIRTLTRVTRYLMPDGTIQEVKEVIKVKKIPDDPNEECLYKTTSKSQQIDCCCASDPKNSNKNRYEHDPNGFKECMRPDSDIKDCFQDTSSKNQYQCESCMDKGHKQRSSKIRSERCNVSPKTDLGCDLCDGHLHQSLKSKQTTKSMTTDRCKICRGNNKQIEENESSNVICAKCEISKERLCEKHKNISEAEKSKQKTQKKGNKLYCLWSDSKCNVCADENKMKPKKSIKTCDTCSAKMWPKCKTKPLPKVSYYSITVKSNTSNCLKSDEECSVCLKSKQSPKSIDSCDVCHDHTNTFRQNKLPNVKCAKCEISEEQLCEKHKKISKVENSQTIHRDCIALEEKPELEDFTIFFESTAKPKRKKHNKENTMDCLNSDTKCNVCADDDKTKLKQSKNICDTCSPKMLLKSKSEPSPDCSCNFTFVFKGKSKMTKKHVRDTSVAKTLPKSKLQKTPDEPCCHIPVKENKIDCVKVHVKCDACSDKKRTKSIATKNICDKCSAKYKTIRNICDKCSAKFKTVKKTCDICSAKILSKCMSEPSSDTVMSSKSLSCAEPVCPKESKVQLNVGSLSYTSSTSITVCPACSYSISEIICGDCGQAELTKENEPCCKRNNNTGPKKSHDDDCACQENDQKQDNMKTLLPKLPKIPQTYPNRISKKQINKTCCHVDMPKNIEIIYPEDDICACPEHDICVCSEEGICVCAEDVQKRINETCSHIEMPKNIDIKYPEEDICVCLEEVKNKTNWIFDRTHLPSLPETPHSTKPQKTKDDEICSCCSACGQDLKKDIRPQFSVTHLPDSGVILSFEQPKESCECEECLDEPDDKTPLLQEVGLFESKTRIITRVTRYLDPGGNVQEKREVITIKQEMHDPDIQSISDVKTTSYWDESNVYKVKHF